MLRVRLSSLRVWPGMPWATMASAEMFSSEALIACSWPMARVKETA